MIPLTAYRRRPAALRAAPLALAVMLALDCRAEVRVVPGLDLRERYTDNVALAREGQERGRFVTEIAPSLSISSNSPSLQLSARYQLRYSIFNDDDLQDTQRHTNHLSANAKARLVPEMLYLDAGASIENQAVSAFGPQDTDNPYVGTNRTEVRTWRISPYAVHQFGGTARAILRYAHDSATSDTVGFGKSDSDTAMFALQSGVNFRRWAWSIEASHQSLDDSFAQESDTSNASATLRWNMSQEFSISATGGYDKYDFHSHEGATEGTFWRVGFAWQPSPRTSLAASIGERFFGRTYYLAANHRSRNTTWDISYNEEVTTSRSQFFLPAAVDTAALLDRLFTPLYPDPLLRKLAVMAYMRATGLPPALADQVNYLSNRYMLQKQFMATAMYRTARSSFTLNLYDVRRRALSRFEADSRLLGNQLATLNDNTRQRGINGFWNWQLTARSALNVAMTNSRSESLTTGRSDETQALGIALTRQFTPRLRAAAEVRHVRGALLSGDEKYRENSISASVSMQF
ncbi:MAG TPA: TIGR03016 family PEP-CTERM system-associated outer membrane protein [Telluria sp.]